MSIWWCRLQFSHRRWQQHPLPLNPYLEGPLCLNLHCWNPLTSILPMKDTSSCQPPSMVAPSSEYLQKMKRWRDGGLVFSTAAFTDCNRWSGLACFRSSTWSESFASAELGPYQPRDIPFKSAAIKGHMRSFNAEWYNPFPCLEYSSALHASFCF